MSINLNSSTEASVATVVLDPRVAYRGFGPDDGPLAEAARAVGAAEVVEDLADAAEQLDFAYRRAWEGAASRIAPDVAWNVSAPYHQAVKDFPLLDVVAKTGRDAVVPRELLDEITSRVTVEVEALDFGGTRWKVFDERRLISTATVSHTIGSVQDQHVAAQADRVRANGELLRRVDHDGLRLELFEPTSELGAMPGALAYVLADHDQPIFAGADFRPSPLHAIDSDRIVEALAEFLALRPGGSDAEFFANYTERQLLWARGGDRPARLYDLIAELPGETEFRAQMAADAETMAERSGEVSAWHVRPLDRTDLPTVDLLADSAGNARAQYPAYVSAWSADTGRDLDFDDDLFPTLSVERSSDAMHQGRPVVSVVRGQATMDWAVEHVNYWQVDSYIATGLIRSDVTLDIPATGTATVAIRNATAVAHAGSRVEAHNRTRITALPDSEVQIHPGAAVNRQPGSHVALAPQVRMCRPTSAFRDGPSRPQALGL